MWYLPEFFSILRGLNTMPNYCIGIGIQRSKSKSFVSYNPTKIPCTVSLILILLCLSSNRLIQMAITSIRSSFHEKSIPAQYFCCAVKSVRISWRDVDCTHLISFIFKTTDVQIFHHIRMAQIISCTSSTVVPLQLYPGTHAGDFLTSTVYVLYSMHFACRMHFWRLMSVESLDILFNIRYDWKCCSPWQLYETF